MSEDEINNLLCKNWNNYFAPALTDIDRKIEKLRGDIRKEHEDLLMRAVNAETKLKLYEDLFSKLNLNMEVKNNGRTNIFQKTS